jgi:hypothetical protein
MSADDLFDLPTERTEFSDTGYAGFGRSLVFATRFEANCRALGGKSGTVMIKSRSPVQQERTGCGIAIFRAIEQDRVLRFTRARGFSVGQRF